jgi:hypothetical protein
MAIPHNLMTGGTTVGTGEVQLTSTTMDCRRGILIKAKADNAGTVYIGLTGVLTTTGFELSAKESVVIPHLRASEIYVIASEVSQYVYWVLI